jgi:two-component system CheB/CheR fusion protein
MEAALAEMIEYVRVFVRRPEGEILHWTTGCHELYGYDEQEAVGQVAHDLLKTEFPEPRESVAEALASAGKWSGRLRQSTKSGRTIWTETLLLQRKSANHPGTIVVQQSTDITDRVELEEKAALLSRELQHRVRNILAIVQSFIRMSFPDAPPARLRKMEERLGALGEAVTLLQESSWEQADLAELISEISNGLGIRERIETKGPKVAIGSDDAMGVSLALHELCTNALKYGALSNSKGKVVLTWQCDQDTPQQVLIRWREVGGPRVAEPTRTGFGTLLIRKSIPGPRTAEIAYAPDGLRCELRARRAPALP